MAAAQTDTVALATAAITMEQGLPLPLASAHTPLTPAELFMFESTGFLVVEDALSPEETAACLAASERVHSDLTLIRRHQVPAPQPLPTEVLPCWRQLGCMYEYERALEQLIDHPSVFQKLTPLLGEHFILHSSWCTMVPRGYESGGGGFHQDASGPSLFRRLGTPAPLVQVRVGFVLTDLSESNTGKHKAALYAEVLSTCISDRRRTACQATWLLCQGRITPVCRCRSRVGVRMRGGWAGSPAPCSYGLVRAPQYCSTRGSGTLVVPTENPTTAT